MLRFYINILIFSFISVFCSKAQTSDNVNISLAYPVYSQYLQNGLVINPAYAGSREALSLFASTRLQWAAMDGAPVLESISLHTMMKNDRVGLGLTGQFMQYGVTKSNSVYFNYAYHLRIGSGRLSLGLRAGADMSNSNYSNIYLNDKGDSQFTTDNKPYTLMNVGSGFYLYFKKFFVGAAVPSFLGYARNSNGDIIMMPFSDFDVYATAGALFTFSPALKFKPSIFVDYPTDVTREMRIDFNGNFIICDFLWIGGSYRTSEKAVVGILQLQLTPQLMTGFSYDYPMGTTSSYSLTSYEFVLRYEFGKKISAANPRYF